MGDRKRGGKPPFCITLDIFSLAYGYTISAQFTVKNLFFTSLSSIDIVKTPHCFNSTKYKVSFSTSALTLKVNVNS